MLFLSFLGLQYDKNYLTFWKNLKIIFSPGTWAISASDFSLVS